MRRVLRIPEDLNKDEIKAILEAEMSAEHNHLNVLMDEALNDSDAKLAERELHGNRWLTR